MIVQMPTFSTDVKKNKPLNFLARFNYQILLFIKEIKLNESTFSLPQIIYIYIYSAGGVVDFLFEKPNNLVL